MDLTPEEEAEHERRMQEIEQRLENGKGIHIHISIFWLFWLLLAVMAIVYWWKFPLF